MAVQKQINLADNPRFLIARLSAVGDCIHTIPVVHALKRRFPNSFVAWVTQGGPATLLNGIDAIDEIITVPRGWMKSPSTVLDVRKQLRSLSIDVAIDAQSLTKSTLLAWLSGAKHRIGFAKPQGRELSTVLNNILVEPHHDHVVDRYLSLLEPMGIENPEIDFAMPEPDEPNVTAFLTETNLQSKPFVTVNPGAGWPSKVWPASRYGEVASRIGNETGLHSIVTWAGDEELAMAKQICDSSNGFAVAAPSTSLTELRTIVRKSSIFVGSDTGPMHLAVAVGTPCVAIFGPTSPTRCGPYGDAHIALHIPVESNQKIRSDDNSAMLKIDVDLVAKSCLQLLQTQTKRVA